MNKNFSHYFNIITATIIFGLFVYAVTESYLLEMNTISHNQNIVSSQSMTAKDYLQRATTLTKQKKWNQVIQNYQLAIQLQPESAKTHYSLALILAQKNRIPEAIAALETAHQLQPQNKKYKQTLEFYHTYLK